MSRILHRLGGAALRVLAGAAVVGLLQCICAEVARAQFGEQPIPAGGITVPLVIKSQDEFLASAAEPGHYAPMLDMRRRILANAYAWGAELAGPVSNMLTLSEDLCREDGAGPVAGNCTPVPSEDVDRLEVAWADDEQFVQFDPVDTVVHDEFNRLTMRETLLLEVDNDHALSSPGLWFRFLSGPAALYNETPRWSTLAPDIPTSEATGFEVESIRLLPNPDFVRNTNDAPTLRPYERAMIVLLGVPEAGEDSVTFVVDPDIELPTVAAWLNVGDTVRLYYECGMPPNSSSQFMEISSSSPDVLDLTEEDPCESEWYITAVNTEPDPAVINVKIGALAGTNRIFDLVVGIQHPATQSQIDFVRRTMREAAWRFYGVTGGSHLIRTFTYLEPPNCGGAHICWRNTTECTQGDATTHPSGSTPSITVDICRDLTGKSGADDPGVDERTMAHEFGHLLTANGTLNHLGDEYWYSNDFAKVCGESGVYIHRCAHSLMAKTPEWMASLCTSRTHAAATQVMQQTGPGGFPTIGMRSIDWSTATTTVVECQDGTNTYPGIWGNPAWSVLAETGAAPFPHPEWSPDNHDFENFANSSSDAVGHNL